MNLTQILGDSFLESPASISVTLSDLGLTSPSYSNIYSAWILKIFNSWFFEVKMTLTQSILFSNGVPLLANKSFNYDYFIEPRLPYFRENSIILPVIFYRKSDRLLNFQEIPQSFEQIFSWDATRAYVNKFDLLPQILVVQELIDFFLNIGLWFRFAFSERYELYYFLNTIENFGLQESSTSFLYQFIYSLKINDINNNDLYKLTAEKII